MRIDFCEKDVILKFSRMFAQRYVTVGRIDPPEMYSAIHRNIYHRDGGTAHRLFPYGYLQVLRTTQCDICLSQDVSGQMISAPTRTNVTYGGGSDPSVVSKATNVCTSADLFKYIT